MKEVLSVKKYIKKHYKSQAAFVNANDVTKQRITEWINSDFVFVGDDLYSLRRRFKKTKRE